jgi:ATP-binding cassette subfamily B multidrug efflux pump
MKDLVKLFTFIKPYWKQSLLASILLTAVVFMDLAIPRLIQQIIDQGIGAKDIRVVGNTTLIMLGISILSALFAIGNNILSVWVGEGFARDLREAMFLKVQTFSFGNLDRLRTGQLIVRLTSDITIVQRIVRMSMRIGIRAPLLMVGSLILMFSTNRQLALMILPLMLITGIVIVFFILKLGGLFLAVQNKLDQLNNVLQENIAGVRVIKAFVRKTYENQRFERANEDLTRQNIEVMRVMAFLFPVLMTAINIGIAAVIWYGGLQSINGDLTVGEIVAFTNYLLTTMTPLMIMAMISTVLAGAIASAERINEVLGSIPDVQDAPSAPRLPESIHGQVAFDNVCFQYDGHCNEHVLNGINLIAEPGQTVALLGATGSGKSTLVNLIPRFYDVDKGQITIDGVDIRTIQQDSLLAQIGIALQETVLFSGSVLDNIRYGRPNAKDEEVITVAKAAQAHDFIQDLPEGYDTRVEQRGVNLSGGQKQRIAIARALLTRPQILILDDSTSAVDVETETKIQAALDELMENCTSFIVAQRISTVLNADKIVVIDRGRVIAEGTHADLIASSPIYQEIYDSQLGNDFGEASLPTEHD